ncbi:glycoside hydrolase family 3 domain protein [Caldithrix abyssi DSM 13497]|uniref:beta-glucosidase n=1 Tax=Caldithrix abyssi DSM 13497 TaxID=880073 RepID=H1XTT0_CALAY|nr:glycoside hydrolase family 3 N-terminal domain-containing protein [Caldithrix abyssi]APF18717.1 beta-glucosidase [Caldithrix abyssi DSM 13497]EHO42697.1 glycoside hydrolase family 3 domain protein [Caldithrix abyssi DSM 13497]
MKKLHLLLAIWLLIFYAAGSLFSAPNDEIEKKIQTLLSQMTLKEKVGQMTQITLEVVSLKRPDGSFVNSLDENKLRQAIVEYGIGSIINTGGAANTARNWLEMITIMQKMATQETRLGIPILYGIDAIHGSNYIKEATLFPQSIAMAATFNRQLSRREGEITALETRAVGIPWNFNPVLGLGRNPLWPRFWETYGEDVYLTSEMGRAYILGLQGEDGDISRADRVAACMKHYAGYSFPLSGHDRTPAWIPERLMREMFLTPFKSAVDAGVYTVMINSGEVNGVPAHSSAFLLTRVLREEWGFKGLAVSDWEDVKRLHDRDHVAASPEEAVKMAVMAGLDMSMVPFDFSFAEYLYQLVKKGEVPETRIDDAVANILRVKFQAGLFENPFPDPQRLQLIGKPEFAQVSLSAAREAITLLKNENNILPLQKDVKILVTGPTANSRAYLNGGWTYTWQGDDERYYPAHYKTILQAITEKAGQRNVVYVQGADIETQKDMGEAVQKARDVDVIVACLGEATYCETPGNINDLHLPAVQRELIHQLARTGKPIVLVLVEGRPRVINDIVPKTKGILMAYLPGPYGSEAIAEALFGEVNPSGKLPFTYPKHVNDLVCYDHTYLKEFDVNRYDPQWPFGYGLSYSEFEYRNLKLSQSRIKKGEALQISVEVENRGERAGKESVLLYVSDLYRSVTPPVKQLKGFQKIMLQPGEKRVVTFTLTADDLAFVGRDNQWIVEPGVFKVRIGDQTAQFELVE